MTSPRERTLVGRTAIAASLIVLAASLASTDAQGQTQRAQPPVAAAARHHANPMILAHRGASGYRPEHTLGAYRLAIKQGADYIEPDLVATKDGYLVARHENQIGGTTDVARHPEFAKLHTTKTIDGKRVSGWFTEDFTLKQLRTLRAKERMPAVRPDNTRFNGIWRIPTFKKILHLVERKSEKLGRPIGICPEIKHSLYFRKLGLPIEGRLVADLKEFHMDSPHSKVFIQSFETGNLHRLNKMTDVRLVQILQRHGAPDDAVARGRSLTYADMATDLGLAHIARYADGVAASKSLLIPRSPHGYMLAPRGIVREAHSVGLRVYAWTFRNENKFLPTGLQVGTKPNHRGRPRGEYDKFFDLGVDGVFTDFPDTAVAARSAY